MLATIHPTQLVFFDDFDGNYLNPTKWHKYVVHGGTELDNWSGAREMDAQAIGLDQNVVVSNGTCKLILKKERTTWQCASCPNPIWYDRPYSSGQIHSYYTNKFKYGKFESRIRFPTHRHAWSAFWTYSVGNTNQDFPEIDIAESHGTTNWSSIPGNSDYKHVNHSTHRWLYNGTNGQNIEDGFYRYPNQDWSAWFHGNYFDQSDWHTYASEYDEMKVNFSVDGNLHYTRWRWEYPLRYRGIFSRNFVLKIASTCNPILGVRYYESEKYPNIDMYGSNLRFTHYIESNSILNDGEVGRTEIDWVKVYQQHPERDGHTAVCGNNPYISGPNAICNELTNSYVSSFSSYNSSWTYSPNLTLVNGGGSSGTIYVSKNSNNINNDGWVEYNYAQAGCPVKTIRKNITIGKPNLSGFGAYTYLTANINGSKKFYLNVPNITNSPGLTYEWWIEYGNKKNYPFSNNTSQTYHTYGQYVQTPNFTAINPYVKWTVKVTNSCGSTTASGFKYSGGSFFGMAKTALTTDSNSYFIMSSIDSTELYDRVDARLTKEQFELDGIPEDSIKIESRINNIIIEELIAMEPEVTDSIGVDVQGRYILTKDEFYNPTRYTSVNPNPANGFVLVHLSSETFDTQNPSNVVFRDLSGKIWIETQITGSLSQSFNLSNLPQGIYVIQLSQGKHTEYLKLVKE